MRAPRSAVGQAASLAALAIVLGAAAVYTFGRWTSASADGEPAAVRYVDPGVRELAHDDAVQLAALEDGVVTQDEYDLAFDRFAACIAGFGATVTREPDAGGQRGAMTIMLPANDGSAHAGRASIWSCRSKYLEGVDAAVALQGAGAN